MQPEWLWGPEESELHVHQTADGSRGGGQAGSVFAPGPVHELDPQSDLELDILIGRLAGVPLGEDTSLMSWFDSQLPGAVAAVAQAEPSPREHLVAELVHRRWRRRRLARSERPLEPWSIGEARHG